MPFIPLLPKGREAGRSLWSSCLGSSFSQHSKEVGNKPRGTLASLPHATTPNYVSLRQVASPAAEARSRPGIPRYFSTFTSNDVTSCQRVTLPSCKFGLLCENEVFGAQLQSMKPPGAGGRGRQREGFAEAREPVEGAAVPGWCWPRCECVSSELATLRMRLLTQILGFSAVSLDIAQNLSPRAHIFSERFSKA